MGATMLKVAESTPSPLPKVGLLPAGWHRARLDDVANRASGHTPDQQKPEYWDGGIKWVSLADSGKLDRGYIETTDKEISALGVRHSSAVLLPPDTVVLSRDAGVGKSAILKTEMAVSQHFIAWVCRPKGILDPWFLYAWLQQHKPFFERMAVGSTIKTIGLPLFKRMTIDFPPLPEQRKIAEILRTWDLGVEKLEALRAAKEQQLEGFADQLIHRAQAEQQYLREHLTEVSERNRGQFVGRVLSVTNSAGFVLAEDQFAHRVASADISNYKIVRQEQYAYNPSRINVGSIARLDDWSEGALSPMYVVFQLQDTLDSDYFSHWLRTGEARKRIELSAQGSVRDTVSFSDLSSIPFPIPPLEEQQQIARALSSAKEELALLKSEIDLLTRQKRGLMQKLLTGEWRVQVEEAA